MKKLLLLLFSILISFNSYGGSADGKGLKCEYHSGNNAGNPIYIWFENGKFNIPYIEGSAISWKGYRYSENGTHSISFNADRLDIHFKYDSTFTRPFGFLSGAHLDREDLRLQTTHTYIVNGNQNGSRYRCVLYRKSSIISDLKKIINTTSSTNQI